MTWHVCPIPVKTKPKGRIWTCSGCRQRWIVRDGKDRRQWVMYGG